MREEAGKAIVHLRELPVPPPVGMITVTGIHHQGLEVLLDQEPTLGYHRPTEDMGVHGAVLRHPIDAAHAPLPGEILLHPSTKGGDLHRDDSPLEEMKE